MNLVGHWSFVAQTTSSTWTLFEGQANYQAQRHPGCQLALVALSGLSRLASWQAAPVDTKLVAFFLFQPTRQSGYIRSSHQQTGWVVVVVISWLASSDVPSPHLGFLLICMATMFVQVLKGETPTVWYAQLANNNNNNNNNRDVIERHHWLHFNSFDREIIVSCVHSSGPSDSCENTRCLCESECINNNVETNNVKPFFIVKKKKLPTRSYKDIRGCSLPSLHVLSIKLLAQFAGNSNEPLTVCESSNKYAYVTSRLPNWGSTSGVRRRRRRSRRGRRISSVGICDCLELIAAPWQRPRAAVSQAYVQHTLTIARHLLPLLLSNRTIRD